MRDAGKNFLVPIVILLNIHYSLLRSSESFILSSSFITNSENAAKWHQMMSDKARPALQPDREQADDISALRDAFSLNAFRYIDIARQERLASIHARWPLLAELDALQKKEQ